MFLMAMIIELESTAGCLCLGRPSHPSEKRCLRYCPTLSPLHAVAVVVVDVADAVVVVVVAVADAVLVVQ